MHEVFPVVAGGLIGLGALQIVAARLRWLAVVCLSIVVGVIASTISGELELSWGFVPIDVLLALVSATAVIGAAPVLLRAVRRTA